MIFTQKWRDARAQAKADAEQKALVEAAGRRDALKHHIEEIREVMAGVGIVAIKRATENKQWSTATTWFVDQHGDIIVASINPTGGLSLSYLQKS